MTSDNSKANSYTAFDAGQDNSLHVHCPGQQQISSNAYAIPMRKPHVHSKGHSNKLSQQ